MKVEIDGKTYVTAPEETGFLSCDGCIADIDGNTLCNKIHEHEKIGFGFCTRNKSIFKLEQQ